MKISGESDEDVVFKNVETVLKDIMDSVKEGRCVDVHDGNCIDSHCLTFLFLFYFQTLKCEMCSHGHRSGSRSVHLI